MTIGDLKKASFDTDRLSFEKLKLSIKALKLAARKGWQIQYNDVRGNNNVRCLFYHESKTVILGVGYTLYDMQENHQPEYEKEWFVPFLKFAKEASWDKLPVFILRAHRAVMHFAIAKDKKLKQHVL